MAEITHSLSPEEVTRLEELGRPEGLSVEQVAKLAIQDLMNQPDEFFRVEAERILKKNAELYRRLA